MSDRIAIDMDEVLGRYAPQAYPPVAFELAPEQRRDEVVAQEEEDGDPEPARNDLPSRVWESTTMEMATPRRPSSDGT
jgi:hypothetical protein